MAACRWPGKIQHADKDAALKAIRALERCGKGNPDMSAYRCGDHWHIGHDVVLFKRRIAKALKAGKMASQTQARKRKR